MTFCPEHPKRDQNPKFTPLSETTSIPVHYVHLITRNVSQDKSSLDKPCLEVQVRTLINFSQGVHPDLRGISFSAPSFTSEDKEDINEKVVANKFTNLDVTNTSKVSQVVQVMIPR